ncbi:hypothetical protein BKP64_02665 [Marinobacter salinus]|uniref:ATPase n=1 Tax=Marinobacter salinus TaxID=1874317 RepID=A0A1D9GHQ6_9GAMM|nr:hypothetical protein [Marinobacter salinus]AOY87172.1 hypothetical protein BKP64_02665 [Marinobacter salinus]
MEPIRPDDDELRAEAPIGSAERKRPAEPRPQPSSGGGQEKPPKPTKRAKGDGGKGSGRGSLSLLWLLLIGLACAAVAGWYSQNQRIQALESQLEEADYWARQSKLALARFQGELSETGESLQERGASLSDQIAANTKQLETVNSEIGKLWVVSNERNKARLNDHQERLTAVEKGLAEDSKALAAMETSMNQMRSSFTDDLAALKDQTQTSIVSLQDANRQATEQLTALSQEIAGVDQIVESRIRRFEQEQKLGISGMEGRITALEKETDSLAGDGRLRALQNELASVKKTVQAIDSSRAQLTSRLVRLSEEVNTLRSQLSAK